MKVRALKECTYKGYRAVGEVFDVPDGFKLGKVLVAVEAAAKTEKPAPPKLPKQVALSELTAKARAAGDADIQ